MVNSVFLIGRIGQEPEAKTAPNGKRVVEFSLATTERWRNAAGEKQEATTWHDIVAWDGLATVVENYAGKGAKVCVQGKIAVSTYEKDGQKRTRTRIVANNIHLLDDKPKAQGQPAPAPAPAATSAPATPSADDDLPF